MIKYLRGLVILVGSLLLGMSLHQLGIPIPGGVLGLLAFYLAMSVGLVKLKWVERTATLLLRHMVLLFVPLTVGLMDLGPVLSRQAVAITASLLVSFVAVLLTTGVLPDTNRSRQVHWRILQESKSQGRIRTAGSSRHKPVARYPKSRPCPSW